MNLTQSSRATLDEHLNSLVAGRYAIKPPVELKLALEEVRRQYGNGQASLVTCDRVEAAVTSFLSNSIPNRRTLFLLSHALAQPVRSLGGRAILQTPMGAKLLTHWENEARNGRLKPSHWRGLFRSFFQSEQGEACDRLRELLSNSIGFLYSRRESIPYWLTAARRHQDLLGRSPCEPYIRELIEGDSSGLDAIKADIDLPRGSWFWAELKAAALAQIDRMSERIFRERLEHLMSLATLIPDSRDEILAKMLARYSELEDQSRNVPLMEFALNAWESPQLRSNSRWAFAGERARLMVCGWLAQEDLEDFYNICKGTRQVDDRRLRFWLRFKGQMGYTQIVVGAQIMYSRDADIQEFLRKKKGRIGNLTSGPVSNNAILMQIGGWLFVEFSETGNACYAFPMSEVPIELGRLSYTLNELKPSSKSLMRLLHKDGLDSWERKFQDSLLNVGVQTDDGQPLSPEHTGRRLNRQAGASSPRSQGESRTKRPVPASNADGLLSALAAMNVRVVDNRSKGGAIWAFSKGRPFPQADLRELGMKYKSERDGYYWP